MDNGSQNILPYRSTVADEGRRARGWLWASIWISLVSIMISVVWSDIVWAWPHRGKPLRPILDLDVAIHLRLWPTLEPSWIVVSWWLWIFPTVATAAIVIGRHTARKSAAQPWLRIFVRWSIALAVLSWLAPNIAEAYFGLRNMAQFFPYPS